MFLGVEALHLSHQMLHKHTDDYFSDNEDISELERSVAFAT